MNTEHCLYLPDEQAMMALGARLAVSRPEGGRVVHLTGDLGAGKTTLTRGWLRALGHSGAVKSPTYTLVESYRLAGLDVHHFDLYRLADPEELDYLGLDDYFDGQALCLVEWPERGEGVLKTPDLAIRLTVAGEGREARIEALSETGRVWLDKFVKTEG
ncbi:tRNA (adenosine(37)-N6)-threonylcarbamoyltransferase complex ATPase subunit type 1 TsaE [Thioalkalivibrio sulfidiphilus]|uniref:tRNA (adenosine(37)-N6)-threonylcarbamoyltransferase complex ATPase subunit type 1 TsaE n=1 Tax=Thioalkalivibrio sulfidiphilus TaxID=1033854 RepID=UPI000378352A|nr:tRNA (adenosine(37)-N6)-threonylcarbamoyltransferase complex ATPase subunit type 1 TsaE [Thioalkalivibrio sulfidiphilus]